MNFNDIKNKDLLVMIQFLIAAADSKLGIRITFLGILIASIATVFSLFKVDFNFNHITEWFFFIFSQIIISTAFIVALVEIFPKLKHSFSIKTKQRNIEELNMFLFLDIVNFKNEKEFIDISKYKFNVLNLEDQEVQILEQIYTTSNILLRKHKYFERSFFSIFIKIIFY